MNLTTAVFLINKDLRAVLAVYEKDDHPQKSTEPAYYAGPGPKKTMFKTLDKTIKPGDFIVVPTGTRHNMTVVKVTDVDVTVNFDDPAPVQWVIAKLDLTRHEEILKQEAQAVEAIVVNLKELPLYKNGDAA